MKDIIALTIGNNTKINCLDKGYVELLDCMPRCIRDEEETADYVIVEAARCSYQRETKTITDDKTLIRYLMRHSHTSPFEMIEFKFHIKLPLYVCTQLLRHRTASMNILSGRYSELPQEYYIPDILRKQSLLNKQGSEDALNNEVYSDIIDEITEITKACFDIYNYQLKKGVAREQARGVLPYNVYTELYWKMDLKNLLHFLDLRCDGHAQQEIRVYANAILELIKPIIPWTIDAWEDYSPYRGGMFLTKLEVEALSNYLRQVESFKVVVNASQLKIQDIAVDNKLEQKEWQDKITKLLK